VTAAAQLSKNRRMATIAGVVLVAAAAIVGIGSYTGALPVTATQIADGAGYLLLALTAVFFGWLFFTPDWTPDERARIYVIGVLFVSAAIFWSLFEQAGSTLTLFAERDTRSTIAGWEYPASWFQSMNSFFVWAFAPVFAWLWISLGRRRSEPATPVKFSLGLIMVGGGFALLAVGSQLAQNGVEVSPLWLTGVYLLHTFGELCLSPVGLSAITKLAPVRIAGMMMGVWFLAASVGNFLAGRVSGFYQAMPLPTLFFTVAAVGMLAGMALLPLVPAIKRRMGEVN
jgi:POT family proton-dependent oligopeptide transporter